MSSAYVGLAAALASAWVVWNDEPRMFRGELRARLRSISVQYTPPTRIGQGLLLRGEPLEIDLRLVAAESGRSGAESDWPSRVVIELGAGAYVHCLLYTSPSPRD